MLTCLAHTQCFVVSGCLWLEGAEGEETDVTPVEPVEFDKELPIYMTQLRYTQAAMKAFLESPTDRKKVSYSPCTGVYANSLCFVLGGRRSRNSPGGSRKAIILHVFCNPHNDLCAVSYLFVVHCRLSVVSLHSSAANWRASMSLLREATTSS